MLFMGILQSFGNRESLLLWGHTTCSKLDLQHTLDPKSCHCIQEQGRKGKSSGVLL